jgi:hypothetical protein
MSINSTGYPESILKSKYMPNNEHILNVIENCIMRVVSFRISYNKETTFVIIKTDIHKNELSKFDIKEFDNWMKTKELIYQPNILEDGFLNILLK